MNRRGAALLLCVALVVAFVDADRVKLTEKQRYRDAWDMIVGEEFGLPSRSPPPTAPPGPSPPAKDTKEPVPMTVVDPLRAKPTPTATAPPPNPPTPPSSSSSSSVPHTSVASDAAHPSRAVPVPPPTEPPIHAVSTSPTSKLPFASAPASSSVLAPAPAPASTSAPAINTGPMHHRPMTPTPIPHSIRKPRPPLRHRFGHPVPVPVRVVDDAHKSNLSPSAATAKKEEAPTMTTEEVMKELRRYSAIIDLNKRNRAAALAAGKPAPPIMHAAPFSRTTAVTLQSTTPVPSLSHTLEELAKEVVALRKQHHNDGDDKKAATEAVHTQMEHMILPRPTLVPIAHDHAHEHAHVHGPAPSDAEAITDELHRDCNRPIEFVLRFSGSCVFPPHSSTPTPTPTTTPVPYRGYHFRKYQTSAPTPAAGAAAPNCTLYATSQALRTRISPIHGVHMHVYPLIGAHAKLSVFDLEILSEKAFTARGELQFGSTRLKPHTIGFESAGAAHVFKFKAGERSFSAQFRVTGGEHEFKGSTGVVSVNGRMAGPHRVEALVSGVIIPAEALKPRSVGLSSTPPPTPTPTPTPPKTDDQIARDRVVEHRRNAVREWVAKQRKQFEHTNTAGPSVRV